MNVVYIKHVIHNATYFLSVSMKAAVLPNPFPEKNKRHSQIDHQMGLGFNIRN